MNCKITKRKEKKILVIPKLSFDVTCLLDPFMNFNFYYHDSLIFAYLLYAFFHLTNYPQPHYKPKMPFDTSKVCTKLVEIGIVELPMDLGH